MRTRTPVQQGTYTDTHTKSLILIICYSKHTSRRVLEKSPVMHEQLKNCTTAIN
jgi:hypothetical protein